LNAGAATALAFHFLVAVLDQAFALAILAGLLFDFGHDAVTRGLNENGGEGGIRTHGTLARTTVFETVPIDHSGTSPRRGLNPALIKGRSFSEGAHAAQGAPPPASFTGVSGGLRITNSNAGKILRNEARSRQFSIADNAEEELP
jgi:hypothetical protein